MHIGMDKLTAQQAALDVLGDYTLQPRTTQMIALDRHYASTLRFCVAQSNWSFARRVKHITPNQDGTFTIPLDCLILREVRDADGRKLPRWQLVDRTIITEDAPSSLRVTYTTDYTISENGEVPDSAPTFAQYFVTLLAARVTPSIMGGEEYSMQLAMSLEQKANAYRLRAITQDRMQDASNDQSPLRQMRDDRRNF